MQPVPTAFFLAYQATFFPFDIRKVQRNWSTSTKPKRGKRDVSFSQHKVIENLLKGVRERVIHGDPARGIRNSDRSIFQSSPVRVEGVASWLTVPT